MRPKHREYISAVRVLLCVDSLGVGGKERQAVALIKGLRAYSSDVAQHIVCFDTHDFYRSELEAFSGDLQVIARSNRWDLGVFRRLDHVFGSFRPDVVHTNGLISSFYSLPLAKARGVPVVNGSIRNAFSKGGARWQLEKWLLRLSDFRVANSYAGLRSRGFSEDQPTNVVVHNGFEFGRLEEVPAAAKEPVGNGVTVGMVAEFNSYKDYDTFIEAARIIGQKRADIRFVAVGSGQTLPACRRAAAEIPCVTFFGERRDVERVIAGLDIGVLCSFVEGLSNSIMEYMALAKPVVATAGGGTPELVVDGETGITVPPQNPAALAKAIERLADDESLRRAMGAAGRSRLQAQFSIDRMISDTVAVYQMALAHGARKRTTTPRSHSTA